MTGCVVDGDIHGVYASALVVTIAKDLGWRCPDFDLHDWERQWSVDEAEAWLNEHHAEGGHAYGWHDGSFWYLSEAEWEKVGP